MHLNGLIIGRISRVYLKMLMDITVYFAFTIVVIKMTTIVNMFPSKVKEDNDALVRYFVEHKLVVRETVKPSSSSKLQCCKPLR